MEHALGGPSSSADLAQAGGLSLDALVRTHLGLGDVGRMLRIGKSSAMVAELSRSHKILRSPRNGEVLPAELHG